MWSNYQKSRIVYLRDLLEMGIEYTGPDFDREKLMNESCSGTFDRLSKLLSEVFALDYEIVKQSEFFVLYYWSVFVWDETIPFDTRFAAAKEIVSIGNKLRHENLNNLPDKASAGLDVEESVYEAMGVNEFRGPEMARWYFLAGLSVLSYFLHHTVKIDSEIEDAEQKEFEYEAVRLAKYCPRFYLQYVNPYSDVVFGLIETVVAHYALGMNKDVEVPFLQYIFEDTPAGSMAGYGASALALVCLLTNEDQQIRRNAAAVAENLLEWSEDQISPLYIIVKNSIVDDSLPMILGEIARNTDFSHSGRPILNFLRMLLGSKEKKEVTDIVCGLCSVLLENELLPKSKPLEDLITFVTELKTDSNTKLAVALVAQKAGYSSKATALQEMLSRSDRKRYDRFLSDSKVPPVLPIDLSSSMKIAPLLEKAYHSTKYLHKIILEEREALLPGLTVLHSGDSPTIEYNLPPGNYKLMRLASIRDNSERVVRMEKALERDPYEFQLYSMLANSYSEIGLNNQCQHTLEAGYSRVASLLEEIESESYSLEYDRMNNRPLLDLLVDYADFLRIRVGDQARAIEIYEMLLDIDREDRVHAKHGLLNSLFRQKNFMKAEKLLEHHSREEDVDFLMGRAFISTIRNRKQDANLYLLRATKMNPGIVETLFREIGPEELEESEDRDEEREALMYALDYRRVWESSPKAYKWLKSRRISD
ncbi:MAG: hypothetical protein WCS38_08730 [Mesotoga sp.]|uniref:tetratricopeptide repeat protein n=1 Tax=Mesotoga sp. TaxID=2053577 RepID=UPI003567BCD2